MSIHQQRPKVGIPIKVDAVKNNNEPLLQLLSKLLTLKIYASLFIFTVVLKSVLKLNFIQALRQFCA